MIVVVDWLRKQEEDSFGDMHDLARVLYTYSHPKTSEILYVGKADYCTVGERLRGKHKEALFANIANQEGVDRVLLRVGVLSIEAGFHYSSQLLSDVESLLIYAIQPRYNKQSLLSRISRPGLQVHCRGAWQHRVSKFLDQ